MTDDMTDDTGIILNSYPLCFHNTLLESEINERECSDGIYLSNDHFRYFNNADSEELVLIKITKGYRSSYAHIIGVHSDERDMVFMPAWMCTHLGSDCGEAITLTRLVDYRTGVNIRIQPHTSEYSRLDDPATALRDAFENYTVLQSGMEIPLQVAGSLLIVNIIDTYSAAPVCIRGSELSVEVDTPLDIQPDAKRPRLYEDLSNGIEEEKQNDDFDGDFSSMLPLPLQQYPGTGRPLGFKR